MNRSAEQHGNKPASKLEWVQQNRQKVHNTKTFHQCTDNVLHNLQNSNLADMMKIADLLTQVIDDETSRHCKISRLHKGTLTINVSPKSLEYTIRTKWLFDIKDAIQKNLPQYNVNTIVFEHGTSGCSIEKMVSDDDTI